jgi:hypothetical protein
VRGKSTEKRESEEDQDVLFFNAYNPSPSPFSTCRTRYTAPCPPLPAKRGEPEQLSKVERKKTKRTQ